MELLKEVGKNLFEDSNPLGDTEIRYLEYKRGCRQVEIQFAPGGRWE